VAVAASVGTVIVGTYSRRAAVTCIASDAGVQETCCSGIPVTHTDGKVVTVRVAVAVEGMRTAWVARRVVEAERTEERIVTSQAVRDWHMDLKVGLALRTRCVATAADVEQACKR